MLGRQIALDAGGTGEVVRGIIRVSGHVLVAQTLLYVVEHLRLLFVDQLSHGMAVQIPVLNI